MKARKIACLMLASALVLPCIATVAACGSKDGGTKDVTDFGNKTYTAQVKKPTKYVNVKLIRGRNVLDEEDNSLSYNNTLQAGDIIEISSDYCYLKVKLFEKLGEQIIYSPSGQFTFQIPSSASQSVYDADTFKGLHTFTASVASDEEVAAERNLAVNPYDYMYVDEKNNADADTLSEELLDSAAVKSGQVTAYPHAYANRVTRNEVGFYARNAIDGSATSNGHGSYPYQSWGYNQKDDAEFVVYFGREVTLDKLAFVLRADYSGTKEHDTYWESATVAFSDGSSQEVTLTKSGNKQTVALAQSVTTTSVRIKNLKAVQSAQSDNFAALTEFEAYGRETVSKNTAATKTTVTTTFGGEHKRAFSTKDYSYDEVKATMDKAIKWFITTTEQAGGYKIPNYNDDPMTVKLDSVDWKDAVYYSGLSEAFLTTGDMSDYYFLRAVSDEYKYLNNKGNDAPHGDDYQIGETYLQLNDLRGASYKLSNTLANANYNLARDMNDKKAPTTVSGEYIDPSKDWSHMGFWWCDALYMAMNTYTLLARITGESKYVEQSYEAYKYWKKELYNETYHLWWRDSSQKSLATDNVDPETGEKYPVFWARGNAWVLAMLAKQMMYLDAEKFPAIYDAYQADYLELAEAILKYQRDDGAWNASIVDGNYFAGKETTGTCGFIYGYCVGLEMGILNKNVYYPAVSKAYDCVVNECTYESGQVGYMQTTGFQPQNYKSEEYSKELTHEFGMGLFLLASSGMIRICADYTAPEIIVPADPQAALLG